MKEPYKMMPVIEEDDIIEAMEVMKSGLIAEFSGAHKVRDFEVLFSKYLNVGNSIALNSGTSSLHVAYNSVGINPGDRVIVPPFTFIGSVSPLLQLRAIPEFGDISRENYCLDVDSIEKSILKESTAILPVHLYGNAAEMDEIMEVAEEYELAIIEDAAQAHGAKYRGRKVGTFGDAGCFSFALMKNMTTGEGGMIVTDDDDIAYRSKLFRQNGKSNWRTHNMLGCNYRMTDIQAAIGISQLKKLDRMNLGRKENARIYSEELEDTDFILPEVKGYVDHVFFKFPILMPEEYKNKRDEFVGRVKNKNVPLEVGYPYPLYKVDFLNQYKRKCPVAEDVTSRVVNLYTSPNIPQEVIVQTCNAVKGVIKDL